MTRTAAIAATLCLATAAGAHPGHAPTTDVVHALTQAPHVFPWMALIAGVVGAAGLVRGLLRARVDRRQR